MALAHHDAAGRDQRRGGEAHFVRAEQCADHDVTAGAEAAVDLNDNAAAQPFPHQRLVGFGDAEFPRRTGMLDRSQRRGTGAALEARDGDVIRACLRDAGGDGADADFGNQLHRDRAVRIDVLQIVDELCEIFDGVDVVMRRRRDQADAGGSNGARGAMVASTLWPGNWPPSPGFAPCAILICIMSELTRYSVVTPKRPEGHLLDGRAHGIAVRHRLEAIRFLAAFAGVGLAADPVHRNRQRGVRLARDRAERHRAGGEALDDVLGRLDFVERYRLALVFLGRLDAEQAAQGEQLLGLLVEHLGEGAIALLRVAAHRVLKQRHGFRVPRMVLAA